MLVCVRLTFIRFFLADSIALRMACGTSLALPEPWPTTAADGSPTTTSAANERFLPPLTTLVTRLMATTWSLSWYEPASSFLIIVGILDSRFLRTILDFLELKSRFASSFRERLYAPMIEVAAAIKDNLGHAFGLSPLGDRLADHFGRRYVPGGAPLFLL